MQITSLRPHKEAEVQCLLGTGVDRKSTKGCPSCQKGGLMYGSLYSEKYSSLYDHLRSDGHVPNLFIRTQASIVLFALSPFPHFPTSRMKVSQKIEKQQKEGKIWWSFEYFPPRTAQVWWMSTRTAQERLIVCSGLAKSFGPHRAHESLGTGIYRHNLVRVFSTFLE